MKYSLWKLVHESCYTVMAYKVKDTNSDKEVDRWMEKDWRNAASTYHPNDEVDAGCLQVCSFQ